MKSILILIAVILGLFLLSLIGLSIVGLKIASLRRTHDPFPLAVRTQLDTLNDERQQIEWLVQQARVLAKESDSSQERQAYDELATEANACLKTARDSLALNAPDAPYLSQKLEERLIPKANELLPRLRKQVATFQSREPQSYRVGNPPEPSILVLERLLEKGWHDIEIYLKRTLASDAQSIRITVNQLDEMMWRSWPEIESPRYPPVEQE